MARRFARLAILVQALGLATAVHATDVTIPDFLGPAPAAPRSAFAPLQRLHILVTDDARPFSFLGKDGSLTGFDIDMANAICARLQVADSCEVSALPFEKLTDALVSGQADAVMGRIPVSSETRLQLDFSRAYFKIPARFVARKSAPDEPARAGARVGVLDLSPYQAMFADFFPKDVPVPYPDAFAMLADVEDGKIDTAYGDGLALSLWLDTDRGNACCRFIGGPYLSTAYLGPGLSVAMRPGNDALTAAVDDALQAINADGTFAELYLRWFPIGLY